MDIESKKNSLGYQLFLELGQVLSGMRCDNGICLENAPHPTTAMYLLNHTQHDKVEFAVRKTNVCCQSFKEQLMKKADDIAEKYTNIS